MKVEMSKSRHIWFTLLWTLSLIHGGEGQKVRCDMPADVVFLLDASASIKPSEWEQEKEFVGILIDSLDVEPYAINVGIIVYSTEIGQVVDLYPFKTKTQLKAELPKLVQTSQGTDTARAIARMRQMMQNQARDEAKKIAVVITDGRSENTTATIQEAVYARQLDGIAMIALGVGNETFRDELEEIAKSDYNPYSTERLFTVKSFTELQGVVDQLRNLICQVIPEKPTTTTTTTTTTRSTPTMTTPDLGPISCPRPADVIFLLDGSHSITDEDWAMSRVFVTTLINSLEVDQEAIHAGIIVYSSDIGDTVPLKPFLGKDSLKSKASALNQPPLGRTNTALGLNRVRDMFMQQGRSGIPHIGLVITDGKSSNVQATINEANLAKRDGVVLVVVGVGEDTLATELDAMVTSHTTLFNVTDFSALFDIAQALREIICISTDTTTTLKTTSTPRTTPSIPDLCQECLVKGGVGYNSYPPACSKYVVCYPKSNGGYEPVVKDCPFGLFWSTEAVACMDAAYVNCPADPCRSHPEGWGHGDLTQGCGEYWVCRGGRSEPHCCPQGQSYDSLTGCSPDNSCRDVCTLQSTMDGSGACTTRPNPDDPVSFLQLKPAEGYEVKPCPPGTVYNHDECACVSYSPSLGCVPSVHYPFDGTFDDRSLYGHAADVERVLLTNNGSAYFDGNGHVRLFTVPKDEFRDRFVLRIRFRVKPEQPPDVQWNDNYKWGLQEWFSTKQTQQHNLTFSEGKLPDLGPRPILPSGQKTPSLEQAILLANGTVLHAGRNGTFQWPNGDLKGFIVTKHHLGPMKNIELVAVSSGGGVVYIPNHQGHVLVMSPAESREGPIHWKIVSKDGQVMTSGTGQVPAATAETFHFQLHPDTTLRWFIMTPDGTVLNSGTGPIPPAIRNLYSGYLAGKLVMVYQVGENVTQWSVSRPDGSGSRGDTGPIPASIRQQLKLDKHLQSEGGHVKRWAVLSSSGDILDSGNGKVPYSIFSKYSGLRSGLVLTDSSSHWQLQRPDGTSLLSRSGSVPAGVTHFMSGSLVDPNQAKDSPWTVELSNGTTVSGKGPVPDQIRRLFGGPTVVTKYSQETNRWYVTDAEGKVIDSGFGEAPQDLTKSGMWQTGAKVVQQFSKRGSNIAQWELRNLNGVLLSSGDGQPPPDAFQISSKQGPQKRPILSRANAPHGLSNPNAANIPRGLSNPNAANIPRGLSNPNAANIPRGLSNPNAANIPPGLSNPNAANIPPGLSNPNAANIPPGLSNPNAANIPPGLSSPNTANQQPQSGSSVTSMGRGQGLGGMAVSGGLGADTLHQHMVNIAHRSRMGPADTSTLVDTQIDKDTGVITRRWSAKMPDKPARSIAGPSNSISLALLEAKRKAERQKAAVINGGPRFEAVRHWTVTMPDGSQRSGVGQVPADLQSLIDTQTQRDGGEIPLIHGRWSVTSSNGAKSGSPKSGVGAGPKNLASPQQPSGDVLSRGRRAANEQYRDVLGDCGNPQAPSFLLSTTEKNMELALRTTHSRRGQSLTLPVTAGMNDVQFVYDGKTLSGFSNGIQKSTPLTGSMLPIQTPVTVGKCRRNVPNFRGEIDEISISACLP